MTQKQIEYVFTKSQSFLFKPNTTTDQAELFADGCEFTKDMRFLFLAIVKSVPIIEL